MFRLIGLLVLLVVGFGGYLVVDYNNAKRAAATEDSKGLTFTEYLGGFSERIAGLAASSGSARGLPTELAGMLPKPPEGWTALASPSEIAGLGLKVMLADTLMRDASDRARVAEAALSLAGSLRA